MYAYHIDGELCVSETKRRRGPIAGDPCVAYHELRSTAPSGDDLMTDCTSPSGYHIPRVMTMRGNWSTFFVECDYCAHHYTVTQDREVALSEVARLRVFETLRRLNDYVGDNIWQDVIHDLADADATDSLGVNDSSSFVDAHGQRYAYAQEAQQWVAQ